MTVDLLRKHWKVLRAAYIVDHYDSATLAFVHSVLTLGAKPQVSRDGQVPLYVRIEEMENIEKQNKELRNYGVSSKVSCKNDSCSDSICLAAMFYHSSSLSLSLSLPLSLSPSLSVCLSLTLSLSLTLNAISPPSLSLCAFSPCHSLT